MGELTTTYRIEEASQYGTTFKSEDEARDWADSHFPRGYSYKLERVVSEHTVMDATTVRPLEKRIQDEIKTILEEGDMSPGDAALSIVEHLYPYLKDYD